MPIITIIKDRPVLIPGRDPDAPLSEAEASDLNNIFVEALQSLPNLKKISSAPELFLTLSSIDPIELISSIPIDDPIETEAISIASEMIRAKLDDDDLPPATNLESHAKQLLTARPDIRRIAAARLVARAHTLKKIQVARPKQLRKSDDR